MSSFCPPAVEVWCWLQYQPLLSNSDCVFSAEINPTRRKIDTQAIRSWRAFALLWLVCFAGFLPFAAKLAPFWFFDPDGSFRISDLAYYLTATRAFWNGENIRVYAVATHIPVLSQLAGAPVSGAMPLAILPSALAVWLPLALIPPERFLLAYSAWIAFSLSIFLIALFPLIERVRKLGRRRVLRVLPVILVLFCSSTFVTTIILGQTSLFALGFLCLLTSYLQQPDSSRSRAIVKTAVFFLSIKIHYLLAALALIVGFRRLALALGAAILVICVVAVLTLRLGAAWTSDYLDSLSLFLSEQRPAWISASFVQENMILFSGAFGPIIGGTASAIVSKILLSAGLIAAGAAAARNVVSKRFTADAEMLPFLLLISGYLLFTPYMGHYEDLLMFAPYFAVGMSSPIRLFRPIATILLTLTLFFVLNRGLFQPTVPIWPFWLAKAFFLGIIVTLYCSDRETEPC